MDNGGMTSNKHVSFLTHVYRRLRYQGATQWITLILAASCVSLWMFTAPLNSYLYRGDPALARPSAPSESENSAGENELNEISGNNGENNNPATVSLNDFPEIELAPEFTSSRFWDGVDWDEPLEMPDRVASKVAEMPVETGEEDVEMKYPNGELHVTTVFYRESVPKTKKLGDVLLLHGARFNSETWVTVDTTKTLAAMGFRATAIDLPGFGNTPGSVLFGDRAVMFIENFCQAHKITKPIIVAPSIGGQYALPYIMARPYNVSALIALVPTAPERFTKDQFYLLKIPVLLMYGSKDHNLGKQVAKAMSSIPNFQVRVIEEAHSSVFVDQPDEFHRTVYTFLRRLEFWWQRNANVTTTPHPAIVTPESGDLPPEATLAPLKPPPPIRVDYEKKVIYADEPIDATTIAAGGIYMQPSGMLPQLNQGNLAVGYQPQIAVGNPQNPAETVYSNQQPTSYGQLQSAYAYPEQQPPATNFVNTANANYANNIPSFQKAAAQQQKAIPANVLQNYSQPKAANAVTLVAQAQQPNALYPQVANQNKPLLPANTNIPSGPNPSYNVLQGAVSSSIAQKKPIPADYPTGGFPPPDLIKDTAIRNAATPSILAGMSEQQFKTFQEAAAKQAVIPPESIPDIRPVPPYEATKEIHRDKLSGNVNPPVNLINGKAPQAFSGDVGQPVSMLDGNDQAVLNKQASDLVPYPTGSKMETAQQPQIITGNMRSI
ncbi:uncharacterized protein LOC129601814 [Paramacrobiotus metropolitanus]|uniref:uncharacterized protein LOC129601814 n=1 Tax=Paramacrobiotus metropolitanus TaxID=2943436 RepID=UPI0024459D78|nr:uncharacterized protein LOC129601814 [Paramacrobiotus metropolitanus]